MQDASHHQDLWIEGAVTEGKLEAVAEIVAMTKSTAVVRIDVNNDGRTCAVAQGTVTLRPPRKG